MECGSNVSEEWDLNIKDLLAWTKCLVDVSDRTKCPARRKKKIGLRKVTVTIWQSWD